VHKQTLGDMLLAANLIDEVQMQIALAEQKRTGRRFGSTLVDLKFIDENVLAAFLSKQIDVPCISLLNIDIPKKVLRKMNRSLAGECKCIPVRVGEDGRLGVAMVDPTDVDLISRIEAATGMTVTPLIAPESSINAMIDRFYPEELGDDDTVSVRRAQQRNAAADPIFWDLIEELDSADIDQRLTRIEQSLDRIWTLLERVLRELEVRR
jgi:Type II secretion system (T2SS), protein E, N-terminal domain